MSLSIGAFGNCLVVFAGGYALQPARVPSYTTIPMALALESTPRPEPGVCGSGPCICGAKRLSRSVVRSCQ